MSADRLLVAAEVAELLGVSERWVLDHARKGNLPRVKLGAYVRFRREVVLAWIEEQEEPGGAAGRKHRPRGGGE